ncbi:hypothetical protein V7149_17185 [Bacillus sp. JJ1503]|uniref:hypothetical protein n=1 Tax=unclassified Bacillus (in: firmicutes) TaxID=185979 RepID=UPI0030001455
MKKKISLSLFAVLFVAIAIMGTVAYFSKSFTSDSNTATAASFEVDAVNADGTTIGNGEFNLDGKLYPGMKTIEAYSFKINKNNTEVPVEYKVNLTPSGDLFPEGGGSPIAISMQRELDGRWVEMDYSSAFKPDYDTESFKIYIDWPHGDNDIDFQGKTGNIKLEVVATQVDGEETGGPTDPGNPNEIQGSLEDTVKGEAANEGKSEIVVFDFGEGKPTGGNSGWNFRFNDNDGVNAIIIQTIYDYLPPEQNRFDGERLAKNLVNSIDESRIATWVKFKSVWEIKNEGSKVIFTSKEKKDYNVKITISYTHTGHPNIPEDQTDLQDGSAPHPGVNQVNTLTVQGTVQKDGALDVSFSDGTTDVTKTINLVKADTPATIAAKIAAEFSGLAGWDVTNAEGSADVVFTTKAAEAHKEVSITLLNN